MSTRDVAWDVDLVHDLFNDWDANLILSIPLSSSRERDVWFWCLEKTGHFLVKSTYKLLQMQKEAGAQPNNSDFWNYIWKLHAPPKVKDLVWRATSDCLPTKNVIEISACAGWLEAMFKQVEKAKRDDIAVLCWALWKTRNELLLVPTTTFLIEEDGWETWQRPPATKLKINVDAATFDNNGTFSFVCVARDANGSLVEAITRCQTRNTTLELAEAMGVREAISWIKQKAWYGTVVETDCLSVVQAIRSNLPFLSYFGSIISDCKLFLEQMRDVSVNFIRRSTKRVAHSLARASYFVVDRTLRSNDVFIELLHVIVNDCS
uniref:RNase H type-1 domain-containing protein n=1 Tax=Cannabis sativa TaxID=3483 RepID=A0A803P625_CANSA